MYKRFFISSSPNILSSPIEYLTGISALRGDMLRKELNIFSFKDLLEFYPIRHIDKTNVDKIAGLSPNAEYTQVAGILMNVSMAGEKRSRRMVAHLKDDTGIIELVWFQGINWVEKILVVGHRYLVFGKLGFFMGKPQIAHPELENFSPENAEGKSHLEPIYPSTEKLKAKGITGRAIGKFTQELFKKISEKDLPENLPDPVIKKYKLIKRFDAVKHIHLPASELHYQHAVRRLKFEEFFFAQLSIQLVRISRQRFSRGGYI